MFLIILLFFNYSFFDYKTISAHNNIESNANIFKSLRSKEVNLRNGPGFEYKTIYTYKCCGMPVIVIKSIGSWIMIEDIEGTRGWVNSCLLSNIKTICITSDKVPVYSENNNTSTVVAYMNKNVVARIKKVSGNWFMISVDKVKGWIENKFCWGYK